jgi:hypothetical protein
MHPYLPHLLSDIADAYRSEFAMEPENPKTFHEEMEEIERWVEDEEPAHDFGYYCGLRTEQFPPPQQFTIEEIKLVCKAFQKMMYTWNVDTDLPETLPANRYYELLISTLNFKTDIVSSGFITFEFCSCYPPACILKEHCTCSEFWNIEETELPQIDELPF